MFDTYRPDVAEEIVGGQGLITAQNVLKQPVGYKRAQTHLTIATLAALDSRVMGSFLARFSSPYGYKTYAGTTEKLWEIDVFGTGWVDRTQAMSTGPIASIADIGGAPYMVEVTDVGCGTDLDDGDEVVITGTTAAQYDGTFTISNVTADTYEIEHAWLGTDTGTWTHYEYGISGPRWRFCQFGDYVIAVYGFTGGSNPIPQIIDMTAGTPFADLAATAPGAQFAMTVNQFLVLGNFKDRNAWLSPTQNRDGIWWSAVGNPSSWLQPGTASAVAAQSDYRLLSGGGRITGLYGGEEAGYVFQDQQIWQMTYIGGPVMFEVVRVCTTHGCYVEGMIERIPAGLLFVSRQGLCLFGANGPELVGQGKYANTFLDVVESQVTLGNTEYMHMVADPENPYVYIKMGDHVFVYDWRSDEITDLAITDATVESLCQLRIAGTSNNPIMGTFDASHYIGRLHTYLTGTLETGAVEPNPGGRATCVSARPIVRGSATVTLEVATKASDTDAWSAYGASKSLNSWGAFDCNEDGRFFKFRLTFSAGSHPIVGMDVDFVPSGEA